RFLPLNCREINLDYLSLNREQLFAEAVARYRKRESWWNVPAMLAKREQDERAPDDPWTDAVLSWVDRSSQVSVPEILGGALEIDIGDHDKRQQMRVASILRRAGWKRRT